METKKKPTLEEIHGKQILSPEELAAVLSCGRTTAYKLLAEKTIPSFTIGRLRRVRRVDVESYVAERLRVAQP